MSDWVNKPKCFQKSVKLDKSSCDDGISPRDLKIDTETSIQKSLPKVIGKSFSPGKFPLKWKRKKVTAVFKKGSKKDYSNYHPISLLSIPSKIVEDLMSAQINQHLIKFNL